LAGHIYQVEADEPEPVDVSGLWYLSKRALLSIFLIKGREIEEILRDFESMSHGPSGQLECREVQRLVAWRAEFYQVLLQVNIELLIEIEIKYFI
jgi:hypothetical protein